MRTALRCAKHVVVGVAAGFAITAAIGVAGACIIMAAVKSAAFFNLDPACGLFFALAYIGMIYGGFFGAEKCWRSRP